MCPLMTAAVVHHVQELAHWNAKYKQKFGHVFLIFAQGRSSREILSELCKRYVCISSYMCAS